VVLILLRSNIVFPFAIDSGAPLAARTASRNADVTVRAEKEAAEEALPADGDLCCPLRMGFRHVPISGRLKRKIPQLPMR
jgi:hypothetical protein